MLSSRNEWCRLQLLLYPEGSAYRSETGGMLDALRKLTVEESEYSYPCSPGHLLMQFM